LSNAEWEARFQKFVDPDYYSLDDRIHGMMGSTLAGHTYRVTVQSKRKNGAA
jgi:uncharacterized protein YdcH (DUF465 family)